MQLLDTDSKTSQQKTAVPWTFKSAMTSNPHSTGLFRPQPNTALHTIKSQAAELLILMCFIGYTPKHTVMLPLYCNNYTALTITTECQENACDST